MNVPPTMAAVHSPIPHVSIFRAAFYVFQPAQPLMSQPTAPTPFHVQSTMVDVIHERPAPPLRMDVYLHGADFVRPDFTVMVLSGVLTLMNVPPTMAAVVAGYLVAVVMVNRVVAATVHRPPRLASIHPDRGSVRLVLQDTLHLPPAANVLM
jgi:hypothetical protein